MIEAKPNGKGEKVASYRVKGHTGTDDPGIIHLRHLSVHRDFGQFYEVSGVGVQALTHVTTEQMWPGKPQAVPALIGKMTDYIHRKESSAGKHNYSKCAQQGKFNEYGYAIPGNGKYACYNTQEENRLAVEGWIQDKLDRGFTEKELLCYYNTGKRSADCPYGANY